jgi:phosphohistidine phosphatase
MRRLVLFRHAKAVPHGEVEDFDRALTLEGRDTAAAMGEWLNGQGIVPDLVLCSSSVRTRETWHYAARAFDPPPSVIHEELIYDASAETLAEIVRSADGELQTLMLVGHNPGIEALTLLLAESGEPEVVERFERKFPPAAVAVLDFEDVPWAALEEKSAWLSAFETPEHLGFKDE